MGQAGSLCFIDNGIRPIRVVSFMLMLISVVSIFSSDTC